MSKIPSVFTKKQAESLADKYVIWSLLRTLKKEYEKQYTGYYEPTNKGYSDSFDKWLENECGIKIYFDYQDCIKGHVDVVDEGKYAWMILKYK